MKTYKYTGEQPHYSTIRVGEEGKRQTQDLRLHRDDVVSLPEDHQVIINMVSAGLLVAADETNSIPKKAK